ncbi:MAG TPA: helix-turn-helix domain-containing protein [Chthoniobacterales bacterium]|jgi:hypothetical protein|nr:helix-turn-helix domain-containing protein [Chthoniobacterales bacterium]
MGNAPKLKQKARSLARRQTAMRLLAEGQPITSIAESLSVTTRTVRNLLTIALATESHFPSSLDAQAIAQLRQVVAERLDHYNRRLTKAAERAEAMLDNDDAEVTVNAVVAIARVSDAAAKISSELSKLFGLYQPTRIVEESLRLQVTKSEHKVLVTFDKAQIAPNWSIDTGFRRVPPDEDLSVEPPKLLGGTNGN